MDNYYERSNLPKPVPPAVPPVEFLKAQTALVTDANSGIGRAIAIALGRAGADVGINCVAGAVDAESVAAEVRRCGRRATNDWNRTEPK